MPKKIKREYGNDSIQKLEGADPRPACGQALCSGRMTLRDASTRCLRFFQTPSTRRVRAAGDRIIVTRYLDHSIEVQDFGRGCPVDYKPAGGML